MLKLEDRGLGYMNVYSIKRGAYLVKEYYDSGVLEVGELEGLVG